MFDANDPLRVEYLDGRRWLLLEPFAYFDATWGFIDVPLGFTTDFASIPRMLWPLLPPTGAYGKAAVVHDWLYRQHQIGGTRITRREADRIFRDAMADLGVRWSLRWLMWSAVRSAGWAAWRR